MGAAVAGRDAPPPVAPSMPVEVSQSSRIMFGEEETRPAEGFTIARLTNIYGGQLDAAPLSVASSMETSSLDVVRR